MTTQLNWFIGGVTEGLQRDVEGSTEISGILLEFIKLG